MSNRISTPFPIFNDKDGSPLDAGFIYFGELNKSPLSDPIEIFYDSALTVPAENPVRTVNGYVSTNGYMRQVFCAEPVISIQVQNKRKEIVWSSASINLNPGVTTDAVIDTVTGDSQADINADTLRKSQNLNDLSNKETARDNLSVYSKAQVDAKVIIATTEEANEGINDTKVMTPKKVKDRFDKFAFGVDQKSVDVTASREIDIEYENTSDKLLVVTLNVQGTNDSVETIIWVDGENNAQTSNSNQYSQTKFLMAFVPPKSKYKITGSKPTLTIREFRMPT